MRALALAALVVGLAFAPLLAPGAGADNMVTEMLLPNGGDAASTWGSWPVLPATEHWQNVDDAPPQDGLASYLWPPIPGGEYAVFDLSDLSVQEVAEIVSVTFWAWALDNNTGVPSQIAIYGLMSGSVCGPQAPVLTDVFANYTRAYTRECGSVAQGWLFSDIRVLQIGIESFNAAPSEITVTAVGATVYYEKVATNVVVPNPELPEIEVACAFRWPDMAVHCEATERMTYGTIIERAWFVDGRRQDADGTTLLYFIPGTSAYQPANATLRVVYRVVVIRFAGTTAMSAEDSVIVDTLWLWLVYILTFIFVGLWLVDRVVRRTAREAPSEPPRREARD